MNLSLKELGMTGTSWDIAPHWKRRVYHYPLYCASCFLYGVIGLAMVFLRPVLEEYCAELPWRATGLLLVVQSLLSYLSDVKFLGDGTGMGLFWNNLDRAMAIPFTVYQLVYPWAACPPAPAATAWLSGGDAGTCSGRGVRGSPPI